MRSLKISAFWGGTGDTGVAPRTPQVTPRFSIYNNRLTFGVAGVAPKTDFLSEFVNYRGYGVLTHPICFARNSATRATRSAKWLFSRAFWGDTTNFWCHPRRHPVPPRTVNPLKSLIIPSKRRCIRHASR